MAAALPEHEQERPERLDFTDCGVGKPEMYASMHCDIVCRQYVWSVSRSLKSGLVIASSLGAQNVSYAVMPTHV